LSFSPELLASTVLLLALNNLFKEIEFRIQRDEITLNIGVYLGIATLLVFSYFIFLFVTVLILFLFTRLDARKLLLLLFGFLLPHILLITLYLLWGNTTFLWQNYYLPNMTISGEMLISLKGVFILSSIPIAYFVFSLFMLNREARFTKYQSQLFQVMFQWLLCSVLQVLITREFTPHSLIVFIPSLAYFISHYLLLIRRGWIAESMLWIFLIGLLSVNLISRYGRFEQVNYSALFPRESPYGKNATNERVMVLTEDPGIYLHNRMGAYFLDWKLSRQIFNDPDYYENVIMMDQAFKCDPPDRIIDPDNLMKRYFDRMPEWEKIYVRDSIFYLKASTAKKRINN